MKLFSLLLLSASAWAAPCITVANCTQWVTFPGGPARSMVYRTYPLDVPNPQITRALVVIHDAGRAAGGPYVDRYDMRNTVHDTLGVPVTYVVSNPSSYAYFDTARPNADGSDFRNFTEGRNCTTFNQWPYGLERRIGGYTAKQTDDQLKKQLVTRPVTSLPGEIAILPPARLASS